MKKTIKLLLIFMGSFLVILVGGIGGYNLIMNNQTFYIYDLRFVVPVANAKGYIYTTNGAAYKTMMTSQVDLQSDSENYLEIAVFVSTSNGNTKINISSSDESVARIEYRNNKCYVKYLKAGDATITTSLGSVSDSFNIKVYDRVASDFRVYDYLYYGENYAERSNYVNKLVCYSDENTALSYEYKYELFDETGNKGADYFNNALLEIDESSFLGGYFDEIKLDTANKKLKIVSKQQQLTSSLHTSIAVKSYLMIDGQKCLDDIFEIDVYIIANEVEFVQIELSTNPDFTNKNVYLNIKNVEYSNNLSSDELLSYLTCQRVEENLAFAGESAIYSLFITDKTPEIYMKFRLVYTNGTIKELNHANMGELYNVYIDDKAMLRDNPYLYLSNDKQNYLECEPMGEYFVLKLNKDYLDPRANDKSVISFSFLGELEGLRLNVTQSLKMFSIEYLDLNNINDVKRLYTQNEDKTYTYTYWDKRTIPDNVIYDENRNVVKFLG